MLELIGAAGDSSIASARQGWEQLQTHLQRLVTGPMAGAGLPEQVAEAILDADDQAQLPCWLQAYFQVLNLDTWRNIRLNAGVC